MAHPRGNQALPLNGLNDSLGVRLNDNIVKFSMRKLNSMENSKYLCTGRRKNKYQGKSTCNSDKNSNRNTLSLVNGQLKSVSINPRIAVMQSLARRHEQWMNTIMNPGSGKIRRARMLHYNTRDCLETENLQYVYERVPLPWLGKLTNCEVTAETTAAAEQTVTQTPVAEFGNKPRDLVIGTPLRVLVSRPTKSRKTREKKEKVEILEIENIKVPTNDIAHFDVFVRVPSDGGLVGPGLGQYAGCYSRLPHGKRTAPPLPGAGKLAKVVKNLAKLKLGLTSLLEDIEAEDADKLVVSLVLRTGEVSVGGVSINLQKTDPVATI
ncbi:hypothetical protein Cni_G12489 [Canna indica]|uniref:Uncharacterized protein n=1 Tax=Canna indica TaxID=4628 RepID=A0AAQ3K9G5_9LILI|nr:hypothetical protein Cni_G12489 [Canna indica]